MMFYSVIRDRPPCKDCSVRHTACHDECRGYAEWKTKLENSIREFTGDDHTISLAAYGFKSFNEMQIFYQMQLIIQKNFGILF